MSQQLVCQKIALTGDFEDKKGELSGKELAKLYESRNSNVVWMDEPWIYNAVQPFVREANINAGWNFQWQGSEVCQWTKYGKEQYYDFFLIHIELSHHITLKAMLGRIRKILYLNSSFFF